MDHCIYMYFFVSKCTMQDQPVNASQSLTDSGFRSRTISGEGTMSLEFSASSRHAMWTCLVTVDARLSQRSPDCWVRVSGSPGGERAWEQPREGTIRSLPAVKVLGFGFQRTGRENGLTEFSDLSASKGTFLVLVTSH